MFGFKESRKSSKEKGSNKSKINREEKVSYRKD